MSDRRPLPALLVSLLLCAGPALAEPTVTILDLPFAARAMREPGSEVAVGLATSGLVTLPRRKPATADPRAKVAEEDAPVAVVWGETGGAVLVLAEGKLTTTLVGADAIEGLAAAETPRGALPGSRRALLGPMSAHLSKAAEGPANLVIRERQPVAMSAEPTTVPIATSSVSAGSAGFAPRRLRAGRIDGRPFVLAVTAEPAGGSALAVVGRADASGRWDILARSPASGGPPITPAAVADFAGSGRAQVAAVRAPDGAGTLQLFAYDKGTLSLLHEAAGYADLSPGDREADLAAAVDFDGDGVPELALPVADRTALAILSLKDGIREQACIPLPARAAFGLTVLGTGVAARLLVGLADGRVALVAP